MITWILLVGIGWSVAIPETDVRSVVIGKKSCTVNTVHGTIDNVQNCGQVLADLRIGVK